MNRLKIKNLFINSILLFCSLGAALIIAEIMIRLFIFGLLGLSNVTLDYTEALTSFNFIQKSQYSELGYELRPNLDVKYRLSKLKTNSVGLREFKEYDLKKKVGIKRVVVIGDSTSMPSGLNLNDAYFKNVEARMNNETASIGYEFINFAVSGYTLRQYVSVLEHRAIYYQPDLILIGWCAQNDQYDMPINLDKILNNTDPIYYKLFLWRYINSILYDEHNDSSDTYYETQITYIREMFKNLKKAARGVPVLVVNLGFNEKNGPQLKKIVEEFGFNFVDTIPLFAGQSQLDYILNRLDSHPNKAANSIFADIVYQHLKEKPYF